MLQLSYRKLKTCVFLYTAIPILIFFCGWLNVAAALIATVLLVGAVGWSLFHANDADGKQEQMQISAGVCIAVVVVALVWCFFGGQGGFVHQTSDHYIRNKIMTDLTLKEWPVTYYGGKNLLCYYIAYWMVPCGIGKASWLATGDAELAMHVSNVALLIWSTIGVTLTLLLTILLTYTKGKYYPILAVVIFVFFSGMDALGVAFDIPELREQVLRDDHIEWWAAYFQFSSNTTQLYWVYNQVVPVWPLFLCMMNERHLKDFALIGALAMPFGPFPFVGMVIFGLLRAAIDLFDAGKAKCLGDALRRMLSPQNFLSILAVVPVFGLYFTANVMSSNVSGKSGGDSTALRIHDVFTKGEAEEIGIALRLYAMFVLFEFGVYVILLLAKKQERRLTAGVAVYLLICPLLMIGAQEDFSMRVSIPGLLYLCIMMIRLVIAEMPEKGEIHSLDDLARKRTALLISSFVLAVGFATPMCEITREALQTVEMKYPDPRIEQLDMFKTFDYEHLGSMEEDSDSTNFFAQNYKESPFYKYICKH